jgi:hypothetical protein
MFLLYKHMLTFTTFTEDVTMPYMQCEAKLDSV